MRGIQRNKERGQTAFALSLFDSQSTLCPVTSHETRSNGVDKVDTSCPSWICKAKVMAMHGVTNFMPQSPAQVRNLADLAAMSVEERSDALCSSGFTSEQLADVETFMAAMPTVHAECSFHVDGHPNIMEGDMVTASVHVALTRPSHTGQGADFDGKCPLVLCGNCTPLALAMSCLLYATELYRGAREPWSCCFASCLCLQVALHHVLNPLWCVKREWHLSRRCTCHG